MRWRRFWHILGLALFVFWLFAVFAAFYVVQKPFTPATARAVTRSALDIAIALMVSILGAALGRRILIWLGLDDLSLGDLEASHAEYAHPANAASSKILLRSPVYVRLHNAQSVTTCCATNGLGARYL